MILGRDANIRFTGRIRKVKRHANLPGAAVLTAVLGGCVSTVCGGAADCREMSSADGKLVRYHVGIVRELTPAASAPEDQIYASDLQTYGLCFDVDARPAFEGARGVGLGLGYSGTRREIFPPECSFVVHVQDPDAVSPVIKMFQEANLEGNGICVISQN